MIVKGFKSWSNDGADDENSRIVESVDDVPVLVALESPPMLPRSTASTPPRRSQNCSPYQHHPRSD